MTVKSILDNKGHDVASLKADQSVQTAVDLLANKRIGAVVIVDDDMSVEGILSERDIVRVLSKDGSSVLDQAIGDIMTKSVITCSDDQTIPRVMELMSEGRFRHLPVVSDNKLAGIVSIGDVVRRRIEDAEREADEVKAYIAM